MPQRKDVNSQKTWLPPDNRRLGRQNLDKCNDKSFPMQLKWQTKTTHNWKEEKKNKHPALSQSFTVCSTYTHFCFTTSHSPEQKEYVLWADKLLTNAWTRKISGNLDNFQSRFSFLQRICPICAQLSSKIRLRADLFQPMKTHRQRSSNLTVQMSLRLFKSTITWTSRVTGQPGELLRKEHLWKVIPFPLHKQMKWWCSSCLVFS